jgi:hypothetical protein
LKKSGEKHESKMLTEGGRFICNYLDGLKLSGTQTDEAQRFEMLDAF